MHSLTLIGGGGFAKEILEVAEDTGYRVTDYYASRPGGVNLVHKGSLPELLANKSVYDGVALAVGAFNRRTIMARRELISWLDAQGFATPVLVSPHAIVSKGVQLGAGSYVAHAAVLAEDVRIGRYALVNTNALVGHDTTIGENVTISSLAFIGGGTNIGDDTLIGAGARVLQGAKIGTDAMVGLGCTVLRGVKDHATVLPKL